MRLGGRANHKKIIALRPTLAVGICHRDGVTVLHCRATHGNVRGELCGRIEYARVYGYIPAKIALRTALKGAAADDHGGQIFPWVSTWIGRIDGGYRGDRKST